MAAANDTPLGVQITRAIEAKRTTQSAVAKKAGLGKSYVGKIMSGAIRQPSSDKLVLIEQALELPEGHFKIPVSKPAQDVARMMQEALDNQREIRATLKQLADDVADLAEDVQAALEDLGSRAAKPGSASKPRKRRAG